MKGFARILVGHKLMAGLASLVLAFVAAPSNAHAFTWTTGWRLFHIKTENTKIAPTFNSQESVASILNMNGGYSAGAALKSRNTLDVTRRLTLTQANEKMLITQAFNAVLRQTSMKVQVWYTPANNVAARTYFFDFDKFGGTTPTTVKGSSRSTLAFNGDVGSSFILHVRISYQTAGRPGLNLFNALASAHRFTFRSAV